MKWYGTSFSKPLDFVTVFTLSRCSRKSHHINFYINPYNSPIIDPETPRSSSWNRSTNSHVGLLHLELRQQGQGHLVELKVVLMPPQKKDQKPTNSWGHHPTYDWKWCCWGLMLETKWKHPSIIGTRTNFSWLKTTCSWHHQPVIYALSSFFWWFQHLSVVDSPFTPTLDTTVWNHQPIINPKNHA